MIREPLGLHQQRWAHVENVRVARLLQVRNALLRPKRSFIVTGKLKEHSYSENQREQCGGPTSMLPRRLYSVLEVRPHTARKSNCHHSEVRISQPSFRRFEHRMVLEVDLDTARRSDLGVA